jgi:hypothetical protein
MRWISWISLALGVVATLGPFAHLLEFPNKLSLDAALWLAVQQHLYRGWGPLYGGPVEIGALLTSLWLCIARRRLWLLLLPTMIACLCYGGMIVTFFVLNEPVNRAVAGWTPATMPPDWTVFRIRWETGHAIAALLSAVALMLLIVAYVRDRAVTNQRIAVMRKLR